MAQTICEFPDEPRIDSPEAKFPCVSFRACSFDVIQQPSNLAARKVGVEDQPRLALKQRLMALQLEQITQWSTAAILPHERIEDGLPCHAVPYDRRLALVRYPNRCNIRVR
jgi:hypothetical protein